MEEHNENLQQYPVVRKAVAADYDSIMSMADLLHKENGMFKMNKRKMDWFIRRVIAPETIPAGDMGLRGVMGVIGPVGGPLEGLIMLTIGSFWYTDEIVLEEYANYVHPTYRKTNHAKTLLKYAQHLSDTIGIPLVIGIISNKRTEAKVRLYRRYFPEAGSFFVYGARTDRFGEETGVDPGGLISERVAS